jgi:magnesium transporter
MSRQPLQTVKALLAMVRSGRIAAFVARARELEPADLGDVLAQLDEAERLAVVRQLPPDVSAGALAEMPEEAHAEDTLADLDPAQAADIVEELEDDDAADMLQDLEPEEQEAILAQVEGREDLDRLLRYDEETAGGRMTTLLVKVQEGDSVAAALEEVRRQSEEIEDFQQVFVVDREGRLVGLLGFKSLVVTPPHRAVQEVMDPADLTVAPEVDQEEVARLIARYNVPSIPVVDSGGRLLGRVTFDDVIDVVEAETTEDLLRFGGVSADEDLAAPWKAAVPTRLTWLLVNLLTAFLAASVVVFFQDTIARVIALAAWMPIIAGMGGNAGTQALAVTVRRLALGEILPRQSVGIITKELSIGLVNGLCIGLVVGLVAAVTGQGARLGLVVFLAMGGNLIVAGFAGAFIPLLLRQFKIDPAIASSIFVTTFTDLCGFALLLGLAGTLLLQ